MLLPMPGIVPGMGDPEKYSGKSRTMAAVTLGNPHSTPAFSVPVPQTPPLLDLAEVFGNLKFMRYKEKGSYSVYYTNCILLKIHVFMIIWDYIRTLKEKNTNLWQTKRQLRLPENSIGIL